MPPVDAHEIAELVDQHAAALELYAAHWTDAPEDCVQEAFVELARQLQRPGQVVAWLYQVVRNRAHNAARAARRRTHHEQLAGLRSASRQTSEFGAEEKMSLPEALAALAIEEREIVVLRIWSGLTWQQIADLTNTSSSGAQRRYVAALSELRKHLEPSCKTNPTCRPS
jgi:RNA polymerase sigma factor (sigma-70 family)